MLFPSFSFLQFVKFANIEEDTPSYHRRYDFFVSKFASMCHNNSSNDELRSEIRKAGIQGLKVTRINSIKSIFQFPVGLNT